MCDIWWHIFVWTIVFTHEKKQQLPKARTSRQTFAITDYNGNNAQFKTDITNTRANIKKNYISGKCPDRCETSE